MKQFRVQFFSFLFLQVCIAALFVAFHKPDTNDYMGVVKVKGERLLQAAPPRIIFVGGSNLAFGLDSKMIEEKVHRNPINMAIHAGLGLDFMLNQVSENLRSGDIVVLSLEYEHFNGLVVTDDVLDLVLNHDPASIRYVDLPTIERLTDSAVAFFGRQYVLWELVAPSAKSSAVYKRESFNQYGDHVAHRGLPGTYHYTDRASDRNFIDQSSALQVIDQLNAFATHCRSKNIKVLYTFPPIPAERAADLGHRLDDFEALLSHNLKIDLITRPRETAYPAHEFYDTDYHLNSIATSQRSDLLARCIVAHLEH